MKVSVVVATCARPDMFFNMIRSLYATTEGYDIEIVSVIDETEKAITWITEYIIPKNWVLDFSSVRRGALAAWNRGLQISTGDIIVPAGDDQIFHPDWLDYALESHEKQLNGYGVVGMNDLAYDGNKQLATMYLMDRQFIKDHLGGVLCPPVYHYYNVDSEINAKSKLLGKFYWDERAKVEHLHSAHGKRPVDIHDLERQESNWMEIDRQIFEDRKARGFPIEWSSLI